MLHTSKLHRKFARLFIVAVFIALIVSIPSVDALVTRGKIYPGVRVGGVDIGGMTHARAREVLDKAFKEYGAREITFTLEDKKLSVPIDNILTLDPDATLAVAPTLWTTGSLWAKLLSRAGLRIRGVNMSPIFTVDIGSLTKLLHDGFSEKEHLPQEAQFIASFLKDGVDIKVQEGVRGSTINLERTITLLTKQIASFNHAPIPLELTEPEPILHAKDLEPLRVQAETLLAKKTQPLTVGENYFDITPKTIAPWLTAEIHDGHSILSLDKDQLREWLLSVSHDINRPAVNAVLELSLDGKKATKFNIGTPGIKFEPTEDDLTKIANNTMQGIPTTLTAETLDPITASSPEAQQFGIKELVGIGTTNFKGSPPNRIKNIKRGASLLNGILIAPGEEFSLLAHLRPFTEENGYLKELVIKAAEGKTVPEIGGGLCQIGTTMFRTVLNAGLPITVRANHSYRVSYYEPPVGMDATIYDPAPDFKFINDTGHWLLLTTEVAGTNLTFKLWGTKDGRTAVSSTPEISNLKQPPEKKTIETLDLPVGKTKCTEHAHIGSDAKFTYTVTYPDGTIKEKEFKSRYRPWQEVCLLGVEKLTAPPEAIPDANAPAPASSPSDTLPSSDALGANGQSAPTTP